MKPPTKITCAGCGKPGRYTPGILVPRRAPRHFCSDECREGTEVRDALDVKPCTWEVSFRDEANIRYGAEVTSHSKGAAILRAREDIAKRHPSFVVNPVNLTLVSIFALSGKPEPSQ
jgi:hypothetical protein